MVTYDCALVLVLLPLKSVASSRQRNCFIVDVVIC